MSHSPSVVTYIKARPTTDFSSVFMKVFGLLASLFITLLILANLIAGKYFSLWGMPLSCGALVYPFTFLVSSVVTEIYGPHWARLLVFVGFVASLAVVCLVWIAIQLPTAPTSPIEAVSFNRLFGPLPGLALGSLISYLIAQLVEVQVFEGLRKLTRGQYLGLRNMVAPLISQLVDTILIVTMVWVIWPLVAGKGILPPIAGNLWMRMVVGQYMFKFMMAFLEAPLAYIGTRARPPDASERAYILLMGVFIGVLLLTNAITSKYIVIGSITLTAGAITYPFTFSLMDIVAEVYGRDRTKLIIWMGFFASLLMVLVTYCANKIPASHDSPVTQRTFQQIFGFAPGIVAGSMVAYITAQYVDIYMWGLLQRMTQGKYLWLRNVVAAMVGQWVDTALFAVFAWVVWPLVSATQGITPISWQTWYQITCHEYVLKLVFAVLHTPFVYAGVYVAKVIL
eukprot:gene288-376_t